MLDNGEASRLAGHTWQWSSQNLDRIAGKVPAQQAWVP